MGGVGARVSAVLALAGAWSSRRKPWKGGSGRKAVLAAFGAASLPFVAGEVATGAGSFVTGLLSIPPLLGAGTAVDAGILATGLAVAIVRVRRRGLRGDANTSRIR